MAVIPAIVTVELDRLKDAGDANARNAVSCIEANKHLLAVQSEMDARDAITKHFHPANNDDRVLLCALQLLSHPDNSHSQNQQLKRVRVVSHDAKLRNRANALHYKVRGVAIDAALAPVLHDESNRFVVEAESMELESPMQQHPAAMTAISDARQVLQAALMACMRDNLPPEDVLLCLHSKTPPPEEPWDVAVVLRELKQKWVSVCKDKLPREVYDGMDAVQLPSASSKY